MRFLAEYRRFVSYIYAYDRDIKSKNVGFAKIEVRDGECRLNVSIKGAFAASGKELLVYLFHREQEMLLGTWMGNFMVKNGSGDFRTVTSAEDISGSGLPLEEMNGIILQSKGDEARMYASGWDDHAISPENFIPVNQEEPIKETEAQLALTAEKEELSAAEILPVMEAVEEELARLEASADTGRMTDPEMLPAGPGTAVPEIQPMEPGRSMPEIRPIEPERSSPETRPIEPERSSPETGPIEPERGVPERKPIEPQRGMSEIRRIEPERSLPETGPIEPERSMPGNQPVEPKIGVAESEKRIQENSSAKELKSGSEAQFLAEAQDVQADKEKHSGFWDRMENIFPKVVAFEDEPDIICLKIDLKDLEYLPRVNWGLANNSFLLHGYYNFRYLILARMADERYIIGIPGMFHNNERFMAAMFGFDHFKPVKDYKPLTGHFGYWYRWIEM